MNLPSKDSSEVTDDPFHWVMTIDSNGVVSLQPQLSSNNERLTIESDIHLSRHIHDYMPTFDYIMNQSLHLMNYLLIYPFTYLRVNLCAHLIPYMYIMMYGVLMCP